MYRFAENAPSRWWSEWKAMLSVIVLEIMLLMTLEGYFSIIFKHDIVPGYDNLVTITQAVVITVFNYFFCCIKTNGSCMLKNWISNPEDSGL